MDILRCLLDINVEMAGKKLDSSRESLTWR